MGNRMPGQSPDPGSIERMTRALALMTEALKLLDEAGAPAQLGAHLDLAIVRLADAVPAASPEGRPSGP
jgi:hypothetical protein